MTMKPVYKKIWYGLMIFWILLSATIMTNSLLRVGGDTKDLFFDQHFLFLEGYYVNDVIPVFVGIYVVLGYFSMLWMLEKMKPIKVLTFPQLGVAVIPVTLVLISLFLLKTVVDTWYQERIYRFMFLYLSQSFSAGLCIGVATGIYGKIIQQEQKPNSQ